MRATIHDVASAAGVSVATVSQVFSGKGRISTATISRVTEAAEQLGYVRNRSAAALREGSSGVIALMVPDIADAFCSALAAGVATALASEDKTLWLVQTGQSGARHGAGLESELASLLAQGVDGVVLMKDSEPFTVAAVDNGMPLVLVSAEQTSAALDTVRPDNAAGAQQAMETLIRQGHRRIAWLGGCRRSRQRAERLGGYCASLLQQGLEIDQRLIIDSEEQPQIAMEAAMRLMRDRPDVTAIVASSPETLQGCYYARREMGCEQQVALAGFGLAPLFLPGGLPVTWALTSPHELGQLAAMRILQRLTMPSAAPLQTVVTPRVKLA